MSRSARDGLGTERHLHGLRFAPKLPKDHRRMLAFQQDWMMPDPIDLPLFDQIPIYDQGSVGRCTGEATSRLVSHLTLKSTGELIKFSAAFAYAMTRKRAGTPLTEDSGCAIPDALESLRLDGICREEIWPSLDDGVNFTLEPGDVAKADALQHQGILYFHCPNHRTIHASLAQGFAVSIGMTVFQNMMSTHAAVTGEVLYPELGEGALGGHDVVIRGFDGSKKIGGEIGAYRCDNSWTEEWGDNGRFWMPMRYVNDSIAVDAESVRLVEIVH